jgi:Flp pilus assembly protein TadD
MEFQKAIALAPSLSTGHRYAMLLAARGKPEQALARILEEQRLDPLSPMVAVSIATILQFNGRFQEAYGQAVKAQELRAENPVISIVKGRILTALGRFDEARAAFRTALAHGATEGPAYIDSELAAIDAASGRRDAALTALPGLETLATTGQLDATMVAFVHGRLGQVDAAYSWLDRAYAERSVRLVWMRVDPRFKPLARDPRFDELVKRMRLD